MVVPQNLESKISEKSDQNWSCNKLKTNSISRTQPASQIWWLSSQEGQNCCNFSFGPIFLKFRIWDIEVLSKLHADFQMNLWNSKKQLGLLVCTFKSLLCQIAINILYSTNPCWLIFFWPLFNRWYNKILTTRNGKT